MEIKDIKSNQVVYCKDLDETRRFFAMLDGMGYRWVDQSKLRCGDLFYERCYHLFHNSRTVTWSSVAFIKAWNAEIVAASVFFDSFDDLIEQLEDRKVSSEEEDADIVWNAALDYTISLLKNKQK